MFHPHGFRRYFKRTVRECWRELKVPLDADYLDFELGHKLRYSGSYDKFDEDYVRKIRAELDPFLSMTTYVHVQPHVEAQENASTSAPHQSFLAENERNIMSILLSNQAKIGRLEADFESFKMRNHLTTSERKPSPFRAERSEDSPKFK